MLVVERMDLACGFLHGQTVFLLLDAHNHVAAQCAPGQPWAAPDGGQPVEPGPKATDWMADPAHPASLALARVEGGTTTLMATAMLHIEQRMAPLYEGATVEIHDTGLRVYARSGGQRAFTGSATPRPRLRPRVDVWF